MSPRYGWELNLKPTELATAGLLTLRTSVQVELDPAVAEYAAEYFFLDNR